MIPIQTTVITALYAVEMKKKKHYFSLRLCRIQYWSDKTKDRVMKIIL